MRQNKTEEEKKMASLEHILELLDELRAEVRQMADERLSAPGPEGSSGGPFNTAKVIPPTRTDDLDSIVGGRPTMGFPECVAVGGAQGFFCSGTLIAPNVVITAKHCAALPVTRVFLNGSDVRDPSAAEIINVKSRHLHPQNDIMLLVLERNSSVTPAHIAQGPEIAAAAPTEATLVGFGTVDFAGSFGYGVKRRVEVPIASLLCQGPDDAADFGCVPGKEMVAGHRGLDRDSCKGDSGGPLYIKSADGEFYLLGATSRGIGSRTCGDGGIYVRVDQFIDWIEEQTGAAIEGPRL
jgi:secreted trypsin-like serine protease